MRGQGKASSGLQTRPVSSRGGAPRSSAAFLLQALSPSGGLLPHEQSASQRPPSHCRHVESVGTDLPAPRAARCSPSLWAAQPCLWAWSCCLSRFPAPPPPAVSTPPGAARLQSWAAGLLEGAGSFSPGGSTPFCTDGGCVVTESQVTEPQEGSQDSGFDWWHLKFLIPSLLWRRLVGNR